MPKVSLADLSQSSMTPIPADIYSVEIIKAEVKTAQGEGKKPTLRTTCEIIDPPSVEVAGKTIICAGRKLFLRAQSIDPSLDWGLPLIVERLQLTNFPFDEKFPNGDIDTDNWTWVIGHRFQIMLTCVEQFFTRKPRADEIADGKTGDILLLDEDGKPFSRGFQIDAQWSDIVRPYKGNAPRKF